MRIQQRKQILETIKTLEEACGEVKKLFSIKDINKILAFLPELFEFTQQINSFVEKTQSGTKTASLLYQFLNMIENVYEQMQEGRSTSGTFMKSWFRHIDKITNAASMEFSPDKIEVAFLPYKASMWDSLESIWLAAKDDPMCDAYVVPIPYYEKVAGGKLIEMRVETDMFPSYVPVTDWRDYDIAKRRPDIIFIHNPYDNNNIVTEVHKDYFSVRLKELTDMLVYVPYFITFGDMNEEFALLPGVINAHKVIAESESNRKIYTEAFKKYNLPGAEKFIALGSPKIDKAVNAKAEDYIIPDDWRKIIEKPDKSRKKVVLYNVRLTDVSEGIENLLAKMNYVFSVFRQDNEVALWFRPHPLNEASLWSLRPDYLSSYLDIINKYKAEGWGIYDDTPDMDRAIALSDAYYGNPSSLVPVFTYAGKPAIIQNTKLTEYFSINYLSCMCFVGDDIWFTPCEFNGLYKMNRNTWEVEYVGTFPEDKKFSYRLFSSMICYNNKLYLVPYTANNFVIYDINARSFVSIQIPEPNMSKRLKYSYMDNMKFIDILEADGIFYLIPHTYPGILIFDTFTQNFQLVDNWIFELQNFMFDEELGGFYFGSGAFVKDGNNLLLTCVNANALLEMDLYSLNSKIYRLGNEDEGYAAISFYNDGYFLLNKDTSGLTYYLPNNEPKRYLTDINGLLGEMPYQFIQIYQINGEIFLIPSRAKKMIKFNIAQEEFGIIESFNPKDVNDKSANIQFEFLHGNIKDSKVYTSSSKCGYLIEYDLVTGALREEKLKINSCFDLQIEKDLYENDYEKYLTPVSENETVYIENSFALLRLGQIMDVLSRKNAEEKTLYTKGKSGESIWKYCKKEVLN